MAKCPKCKNQTILMSGQIYLEIDKEPYKSGKHEKSRSGVEEIDRHIIAQFCENCNEIVSTSNE